MTDVSLVGFGIGLILGLVMGGTFGALVVWAVTIANQPVNEDENW